MSFIPSSFTAAFACSLEWYGALSQRNTVSSHHPGVSLSNYFVKWCRKRAIMFDSVLACDRVNQTRPSVSTAAIIDNLGEIELRIVLPCPFLYPQVYLVKLDSLSHVSSILIILFPLDSSPIKINAYCWRRTRALSELAWGLSFFALMKLNWNSSFNTYRIYLSLTSRMFSASSFFRIKRALPIVSPY